MNCEDAEALVLDLRLNGSADDAERAAALAHLSHCSRCAALQESWEAAREDLRALGEETRDASAPERVQMRLMLEFRNRHRGVARKRLGFLAAWALSAAAIVVAIVAVSTARKPHAPQDAKQNISPVQNSPADLSAQLADSDDSTDFIPLPGVIPGDTDQAAILRVRMQRSSLGALGLPVNEQRAGEWIQVDLLVGTDGLPEAVRLAQEEN